MRCWYQHPAASRCDLTAGGCRAGPGRQPPACARSAPASWITSQQTENRSFRFSTFCQFDSFPSLPAEVQSAGECDHVTRKSLPQAHTCLTSLFVTRRLSFCLLTFQSDTSEIYYLCKKKTKTETRCRNRTEPEKTRICS